MRSEFWRLRPQTVPAPRPMPRASFLHSWFPHTLFKPPGNCATHHRLHGVELLEPRVVLTTSLVINELHIDPVAKIEPVEFVELYNSGTEAADLTAWTIDGGVSYAFPDGTVLEPGGHMVISQDPEALTQKFGADSIGPLVGRLSNQNDTVILRDAADAAHDEVTYKLGFPWPTVGDPPGNSFELVNWRLDNNLGGNWRASLDGPTPGAVNSRAADNVGPQMRQLDHSPAQPESGQDVTITVKITDPDGVSSVMLEYQIVAPGDYISISDPRYPTQWSTVAMRDDGAGGDQQAADDVFSAVLPGQMQVHRHLVRYRITANDGAGNSVVAPHADDPVPNFAYYVYNGVPDWQGSPRPGVDPSISYSSEVLESVQVYQLITTRQAHADSQQLSDATAEPYMGSEYPWEGTLVVGADVYDHIRFRARGGDRFGRGKNPWKIDFNRGHDFQAVDNYGSAYDAKWRKLNFSAAHRGSPTYLGEQGMHEAVGFALFNLAGVESSNSHFVHFRIVESADENGSNQYNSDFQGLYLAIEQPDGRFLDQHQLPDGNLFRMRRSRLRGTVNHQSAIQLPAEEDLSQFAAGMLNPRIGDQWLRDNTDLERFYSYRTILEGIHHYDTGSHNHLIYHNSETDRWSIHPWDLDFSWQDGTPGSANDPFSNTILRREALLGGYRIRARELRDLLFNSEQIDMLIDEIAGFVYSPATPSFINANRALWDRNPAVSNRGRYYERVPDAGFAGMIQLMKDYVVERSQWIDANVLTDEVSIPQTPELTYTGQAGFPLNRLSYQTTPFSSPDDSGFGAIQWRVAEVTDTQAPNFASQPRKYEIDAVWESDPIDRFRADIEIPGHDLNAGATYRVRVRVQDDAGRWSHWSEPHQFVAGAETGPLVDGLRITEVNYHPHDDPSGSFDDNDFEFIEFQNVSSRALDLTGVRIDDGVQFTFVSPAEQLLNATFQSDVEGLGFVSDTFGGTISADKALGEYRPDVGRSSGGLRVLLGPGDHVEPIHLLQSSFDDGPGGFTFAPDALNEIANPDAVQSRLEDGALGIFIGPGDTGGPASGAWSTEFDLTQAARVNVAVTFSMTNGPGFESTEFGEVILLIDDVSVGHNVNDSLAHLAGKGVTSTGVVNETVSVVLEAGRHTLSLGAFNNQATDADEFVDVLFSDLAVSVPEPGSIGATSGAWSATFDVPATGDVHVSLDYRLTLGEGLEADEFGQVIVELDGVRLGRDVQDSVEHRTGGDVGPEHDWTTAAFVVPQLAAGQHTIAIGAFSDDLTARDEFVQVDIDNLSIELFEIVLLEAGQYALIVNNRDAFQLRYGSGLNVLGRFISGRLSNSGEQIRVREPRGGVVQQFTYDDQSAWPRAADGQGSSLEVIVTSGDYNDPQNWRASNQHGGTPGQRAAVTSLPGDANRDGRFDRLDIVSVLDAGKYLTGSPAEWSEGDFNDDGFFDQLDLVFAMLGGLSLR